MALWQQQSILKRRSFKRLLRFALILTVGLTAQVVLFHVFENWGGRRAFAKFTRELEEEGGSAGSRAFLPPPVSDDENFAMHPFLKPIFDFENPTKNHGMIWRDTNGYERIKAFRLELDDKRASHVPLLGDLQSTDGFIKLIDLTAWQKHFRTNPGYPHAAASQTPAQDVLLALSKFDREFKDLEEAARRSKSRFPIHYDDANVFGILLPHLSVIKSESLILNLRAAAQLSVGQTNEAFTTVNVGFKISDSIKNEPLLISFLIRITTLGPAQESIAEGLAAHRWSETQLIEFENRLAEIDLFIEYQQAMRNERDFFCFAGLDYLKSRQQDMAEVFAGSEDESSVNANSSTALSRMWNRITVPDGWFDQNKCVAGEIIQDQILPIVDDKSHRLFPELAQGYRKEIMSMPTTHNNRFAKCLVLNLSKVSLRAGRMQCNLDEARLACALERYRMANGEFPETLDALVPKFVAKLPTDVITGEPLKYRREADGQFVLYSVGLDGVDDGGKAVFKSGRSVFKPGRKLVPDPERGDWIWKYPPAPVAR